MWMLRGEEYISYETVYAYNGRWSFLIAFIDKYATHNETWKVKTAAYTLTERILHKALLEELSKRKQRLPFIP